MTNKCLKWLNKNVPPTPALVFDLEEVKSNYVKFVKSFKNINPYYAVKANPNKKILYLLNKLGSKFDCASIKEIQDCIKLNINPKNMSFGNTIKKSSDIKKAFSLGVSLFAYDCSEELEKIAKYSRMVN